VAVAALIVKERVSKTKHLQLVSGVDPYIYWLSVYMYIDLFICKYIFIYICIYIYIYIQG